MTETMTEAVWHAGDRAGRGFARRHVPDPEAQCGLVGLSRLAGLAARAVTEGRIAPGLRADPFHRHHGGQEWPDGLEGTAKVWMGAERAADLPNSVGDMP